VHLCPIIVFPFEKQIFHELLLDLVKKTKQLYILLTLAKFHSTTTSFDLWTSKSGHDIFAFVIKFLGANW
jgi:hypothetical protein